MEGNHRPDQVIIKEVEVEICYGTVAALHMMLQPFPLCSGGCEGTARRFDEVLNSNFTHTHYRNIAQN